MAEKMMPYALRMTLAVLANKPDDARSISAECVTAMTKELMGVVSRYDLMDFPFMVAALRLTATSLESLLDEHGKGIADNIVANTTCITIDASELKRQAKRRSKDMEIKRGDIWYVSKDNYTGCEQAAGRPAIIVSNEKNNACAETVEVVYLTTQPKKDLPTHVLIRSSERESTALCEQITTVSVDRLLGYKGHLTPAEMTNVEVAMLISLELEVGKPVEKIVEVTKEVPVIRDVKVSTPASNPNMAAELAAAKAKCEMLQIMYESLLNRVLAGKAG